MTLSPNLQHLFLLSQSQSELTLSQLVLAHSRSKLTLSQSELFRVQCELTVAQVEPLTLSFSQIFSQPLFETV